MGLVPIVPTPRLPKDPYRWPARYIAKLEKQLRHRHSRFRRRRRRAHTACLLLIRYRERQLQPLPAAMGAGAIAAPTQAALDPSDFSSWEAFDAATRVMDASALIPPKPSDAARSVRPARHPTGATGATGVPSSGWIGVTGATGPSLGAMGATGATAGFVTGGCGCTICSPPVIQETVELEDGDGRRWLVPVDPGYVGSHVTAKPAAPPANPSNRGEKWLPAKPARPPADASPFRSPPIEERR